MAEPREPRHRRQPSAEVISLDAVRAMLRLASSIDGLTAAVKAGSKAVLEASVPHAHRQIRKWDARRLAELREHGDVC
jgi:hypothetical protein